MSRLSLVDGHGPMLTSRIDPQTMQIAMGKALCREMVTTEMRLRSYGVSLAAA